MIKIMTILGTRPELIKMSRVIAEFDLHTNHILVHTGQNYDYELNEIFYKDLCLRQPDHFLEAACDTPAKTIGNIIAGADNVIKQEEPDAVVLYGDTNSCLSVIAAKRRQVPVFHLEAGNRCFDQRVPEEINRKILDHLSDINLVLTEHSRRNLLAEGLKPETVMKVGSNMREVLDFHRENIDKSQICVNLGLEKDNYFLVSLHREENVDSKTNFHDLLSTLNALSMTYELPIIVSTHPRTRQRLEAVDNVAVDPKIKFLKPFGFYDYIKLQLSAKCVISDSGTITEEASMLNLPAITIRNAHERPEGMDVGTLIMSGLKSERVLESVKIVLSHYNRRQSNFLPVFDYENPNASKHILRIVLSYTDYVNRTVWKKI